MSQLFRRPSPKAVVDQESDTNSGYSSLLGPSSSTYQSPERRHRRTKSTPVLAAGVLQDHHPRPWLSAAESQRSGRRTSSSAGERPPARKLVKEPGGAGSARPSFSLELSDSDGEKEKGPIGRGIDRLKELCRKGGWS